MPLGRLPRMLNPLFNNPDRTVPCAMEDFTRGAPRKKFLIMLPEESFKPTPCIKRKCPLCQVKDPCFFLGAPETFKSNAPDCGLKAFMKNELDNLDTAVRKGPRTLDPELLLFFDSEAAFPLIVSYQVRFITEDKYIIVTNPVEV